MNKLDAFREKFNVDALRLYESDSWTLSVRPVQVTLGSLVVSINRNCFAMSDLRPQELVELAHIYRFMECEVGNLLNVDKFNYLTLMMVDDLVHTHVIPRYATNVSLGSASYEDQFWPNPVDISFNLGVEAETIAKYFKSHLNLGHFTRQKRH